MQPKDSSPRIDSAHALLGRNFHPLDVFFRPSNVAVIGATEAAGAIGRTALWNLMSTPFGGTLYPVNPKRHSVLGIRAYSSIEAVPEPVDLALIITPAATVPGVVRDCVKSGVKGAIIVSAGFREMGPRGAELERQVAEEARQGKMRIIGPNCLGVMCPVTGLNASMAQGMARSGSVGFVSQSGALCTAVLDWSQKEMVGFSAFVSVGSMLDIGWGDLIDYLGNDPRTRSILLYMESVGDARAFLSAAREVALSKPIIVIKAGKTAQGERAASSHTGALTGSDDVLDAAFHRCGVLRVNQISDLFYMAEVLARQPRPLGRHLTILSNAGGPAVLATDALIANGGELATLAPQTVHGLDEILPPEWSHDNPIDLLGDAGPERYAKALSLAAKDPNTDGLLVILTPQAATNATHTAELLKPFAKLGGKPLLASWMGGPDVAAGSSILDTAGVPTFPYPDTAARMFSYMAVHSEDLRALYETPALVDDEHVSSIAELVIARARAQGRTLLTEFESKQVLTAYGIPTVATHPAADRERAVELARILGFPVVLKLASETISHKSDVGGVHLNLNNEEAVRTAFDRIRASVPPEDFAGVTVQPMVAGGYELILGSSIDPQFGPVLLFGTGGQLVEVFEDRALALPPLNTTLARRMMEQTKIYRALEGVRGRAPIDLPALEALLVRFSQLVIEQRWIKEIDINPLMASAKELAALDARIVLHPEDVTLKDIPRLAIRPYPTRYVCQWKTKGGIDTTIRPIRPEDEPAVIRFHETLSDRTVYFRYLTMLKLSTRITHERLIRICFVDYARQIALVAERTGTSEIMAIGRLHKNVATQEAEFALVVSDAYQKQGLGSELLRRLIDIARQEHLLRVTAEMAGDNFPMQRICRAMGFKLRREVDDTTISAVLEL